MSRGLLECTLSPHHLARSLIHKFPDKHRDAVPIYITYISPRVYTFTTSPRFQPNPPRQTSWTNRQGACLGSQTNTLTHFSREQVTHLDMQNKNFDTKHVSFLLCEFASHWNKDCCSWECNNKSFDTENERYSKIEFSITRLWGGYVSRLL